MNRSEIRAAIRGYLALIETGASSVSDTERQLALTLDQLALAMHYVRFDFDESDYPEAPSHDEAELRARVLERFPRFGFYNVPEFVTEKIGETTCMIGDAIEDILEMANALYAFEWCWANTSEDDALWNLQDSFKLHCRDHLRYLQLYLHCLEYGE